MTKEQCIELILKSLEEIEDVKILMDILTFIKYYHNN